MSSAGKTPQHARKRKACEALEASERDNESNSGTSQSLTDDLTFLAPNQMYHHASDLFSCLTTKRFINVSFSNLYYRSAKHGWLSVLTRERRNLKPNINSLEKCFALNRLIAECMKDPVAFAQRATSLHEEMLTRMSSITLSFATTRDLYAKVVAYQNLMCEQRIFHTDSDDPRQAFHFLGLQKAITQLCAQSISFCEAGTNCTKTDHQQQLRELLQHAFLIVAEPASPECVAAAKYEKLGNSYVAKLTARILCLLEPGQIRAHFTFSSVAVTLHSFDRQNNEEGEGQAALEWKRKQVVDAKGHSKLLYYAELHSIYLTKPDTRSSRPLYSSKLCQLHFQLKIHANHLNLEENFTFHSRPFGICSHSQYFPEYVAKVLIYELEQSYLNTDSPLQPHTITDGICRYHTRLTGVRPKPHTQQFVLRQCQALYDQRKNNAYVRSSDVYEEILAKLISQIEFYIDHPVLTMMYYDNLFLGICDSSVDEIISGTRNELHILLRFDTLAEHQPTQQAAVRYIVHNGHLIKATFHHKAFVDDMCRMICESISEKAKRSRILSDVPDRHFYDFSLYFDKEIYRLSSIASPASEAYQPLLPVLWSTMRFTSDDELTPRSAASPSTEDDSSTSSTTSLHQARTDETTSINSSANRNEKITVETDKLIEFLVEKLPHFCLKPEPMDTSIPSDLAVTSSVDLSTALQSTAQRHKLVLSILLREYFQSITQAQAPIQRIEETKDSTLDAI